MTIQEARDLLIYKDAQKQHWWASEPRIPKTDNVYNGKIRIAFSDGKYFKDSTKTNLENLTGNNRIKPISFIISLISDWDCVTALMYVLILQAIS